MMSRIRQYKSMNGLIDFYVCYDIHTHIHTYLLTYFLALALPTYLRTYIHLYSGHFGRKQCGVSESRPKSIRSCELVIRKHAKLFRLVSGPGESRSEQRLHKSEGIRCFSLIRRVWSCPFPSALCSRNFASASSSGSPH